MPESTTLHLPEKYRQAIGLLLQQYIPHADVWAYGSRVNGDYYDASDLDLVVRFPASQALQGRDLEGLREAFSESNIPIFVQILDWDRIPEAFRQEIWANYVVVQGGSLHSSTVESQTG